MALSGPVLASLVAEPLTGLVDTAFVARLGIEPLAALGVGTMVLSAVFWGLSFLGVATQTRVARLLSRPRGVPAAARVGLVATVLALLLGGCMAALGIPLAGAASRAMGATDGVAVLASDYLRIRLLGAPALLAAFVLFGALRGGHDMRWPMWIALGMNAINIVLDPLLIFGPGPFPALGVVGAALASSLSHWVGALWAAAVAWRRFGLPRSFDWLEVRRLLRAGASLVLRSAFLNAFLILGTRKATLAGASAGAVHQVIRSTWFFNALFLDAFAISAQSLVAHFLGVGDRAQARRVALVACQWSVGAGAVLCLAMLALEPWVSGVYLPAAPLGLFLVPWRVAAVSQPVSGLTFGTDGVHFGTGDFRFLRNSVLVALLAAAAVLVATDRDSPTALAAVWWSFTVWTSVRAVLGTSRIWPGFGSAPLARQRATPAP